MKYMIAAFISSLLSVCAVASVETETTVEQELITEKEPGGRLLNIKTAPLSLLVGIRNIEVDVAVFDHWTLGGSYYDVSLEFDNNDYQISGWGVRSNYFFNRALDSGFYLSGAATFLALEAKEQRYDAGQDENIVLTADANFNTYTALAGYLFMWDYFNLGLAAGMSYFTMPGSIKAENDLYDYEFDTTLISGVFPTAELTFGLAF